ncbi:hypothetical protein V5799_029582 [Amblyomma americanum]|uniref:Uncharacterized protein n=1 Tax=Amblyomma americanum TaxID=6943 RepID=A0AAQ4EQM0_AMBAM
MALRPQVRRDSSVTPIIHSFVLAPEASFFSPTHDESSQEKQLSKPPFDPLIHSYRLAITDSQTRLRRHSSLKTTRRQVPRSVSFDIAAPPSISTSRRRRGGEKYITVPRRAPGERSTEYRVFMVSATTLTLAFTLVQPLVLFHCLAPCQEPRCYNVAMIVHESITPSVAPCQDFFTYAVGDAGANRYFTRIELTARRAALHWISTIEEASSGQSAVQKAAALLRGCMKLTMQKNEDLDAIRNVLSAGGLEFPKMAPTTKADVIRSIVEFNLNAGLAPIFRLTTGRSIYEEEGYMPYVAPAYHVLSFADHLQQLGSPENFQVYVRRCAEVVGEPGMSYAALIRAVSSVNQLFTELSVTKPIHVELKLSSSYPKTDFWRSLTAVLRDKFESLGIMKSTFLVVDDSYFQFLVSKVFGTLEGVEITAYIGLYLVWYLSRVASYTLAYSSPVPNYTNELNDMWLRCFADVHTLYDYVPDQEDVDYMYNYLRVSRATAQYVLRLLHNSSAAPTGPFVPPFEAGVPFMASVYNMIHFRPDTMVPPAFSFGQSLSLDYAGIGYNVAEQASRYLLSEN